MQYYHVWVRSERYRGNEPLTYGSSAALALGQIVVVPLKTEPVLGFISARVERPAFPIKPIIEALPLQPLPRTSLQLASWLQQFYRAPIGAVTTLLLPQGLQKHHSGELKPGPAEPVAVNETTLTPGQVRALEVINQPDTYLLHGRTGSGKTLVYLELVSRNLAAHKSAIILAPEIGLTSQLAEQFRKRFGERVVVLHSQLSPKQRITIWAKILTSDQPLVIIGPRSALFCPLKHVGLIIVDESHDNAYKQEQAPYYHATRVAARLRQLHNATLVLGSATPTLTDYYLAVNTPKPIIRLDSLARGTGGLKHNVQIVDLKDRSLFGRSTHLSQPLLEAINGSLGRGEQSLLYLNRRGTARITLCTVCGWQALCPKCDLPLAYHGDDFRLRCHTCGYTQAPASSCPVCGNTSIVLKSFGTKAITDAVQRLFPDARVVRFDSDNLANERLERQFAGIQSGGADILVGTQMLAKGLDLPRLSTLGIILADSSLYLPDYTAQERTYQLLTQVMGRVGRGHLTSQAVVQTYYPDSPLLLAAINDDWASFYSTELTERKTYGFPPFYNLLKIWTRRASRQGAERAGKKLAEDLRSRNLPIEVEGPAPAFHEKAGGQYQWQLVIKAPDRRKLLELITLLPAGWSYDLDPSDLL